MKAKKTINKGFTTLELLLALSVFSVSNLFLHPKTDIEEKANQAVCYYHMKHIAMAIYDYMEKNENWFPPSTLLDEAGKPVRDSNNYGFRWNNVLVKGGYIEGPPPGNNPAQGRFVCPSEKDTGPSTKGPKGETWWWAGTHFGLNGYLCSTWAEWPGIRRKKFEQVSFPEHVEMFADGQHNLSVGIGLCRFRHSGGINICFADGHVEWLHQRDVPASYGDPLWGNIAYSANTAQARKKSIDPASMSAEDFGSISLPPSYIQACNDFLKAKSQDNDANTYPLAAGSFKNIADSANSPEVKLRALFYLSLCQLLDMKVEDAAGTVQILAAEGIKAFPDKKELAALDVMLKEIKTWSVDKEVKNMEVFMTPKDYNSAKAFYELAKTSSDYRKHVESYQKRIKPLIDAQTEEIRKKLTSGGITPERAEESVKKFRLAVYRDYYYPGQLDKILKEQVDQYIGQSLMQTLF